MGRRPTSGTSRGASLAAERRPHLLGVDDGPFEKRQREPVPIVGVAMEGADLVEAVAFSRFPVDGANATEFLAEWIGGLRVCPTLQGVALGGIAIAGLGIVDANALSRSLALPVLVVTRKQPHNERLAGALRAAGLPQRLEIVERTPPAFQLRAGLWVAHAGVEREEAGALVRAASRKSRFPEPLRVAHLIAAARVKGQSRGRV